MPAAQRMDTIQEQDMFRAIEQAISLANTGTDPSDAIAKVASDQRLTRGMALRMVEAFNTSKTLGFFRGQKGEAKLASFSLADPDRVLRTMFPSSIPTPSEEKAAVWIPGEGLGEETRDFRKAASVSVSYDDPVSDRAARAPVKDPDMILSRLYSHLDGMRKRASALEQRLVQDRWELVEGIDKLAAYFRQIPHTPFHEVDAIVQGHWGDEGRRLMDLAYGIAKKSGFNVSRAGKVRPTIAPEDEPYSTVRDLIEKGAAYRSGAADLAIASSQLHEFETGLEQRKEQIKQAFIDPSVIKNFLLLDAMKNAVDGPVPSPKPAPAAPTGASSDLIDPEYDAQRKAIRAQVMLHKLLTEDPVLMHHEPGQVVEAYNQMTDTYPRLMESEVNARAQLRRMMEGGEVAPNDLADASQAESELMKQQRPAPAAEVKS